MLTQIREELDEYLSAINDNTSEIQANYSYTQLVDQRIDQVLARLDHIERMMGNKRRQIVQPLNYEEKKVFLILYTEEVPKSYTDLAQQSNLSEGLVIDIITSLIEKGVPILKSHFNTTAYIKMDPVFKEVQAKENVVNLSLKSFVAN
ncbi:MAG TPA: hypothetical protein VJK72_03410 [Candidatus Nanoarchaeia archaeon]|nr:hypothetical protein [Candidatus Nanoarchaeia archaeon]